MTNNYPDGYMPNDAGPNTPDAPYCSTCNNYEDYCNMRNRWICWECDAPECDACGQPMDKDKGCVYPACGENDNSLPDDQWDEYERNKAHDEMIAEFNKHCEEAAK